MDINTAFTRALLSALVEEFRAEFPDVRAMKHGWVIEVGRGHWEFHGNTSTPLEGFYWHGRAYNAYEARYNGLNAWRKKQQDEAAKKAEGWCWLLNSRNSHWFDKDGRSLCKRWMTFGSKRTPEPEIKPPCKGCLNQLSERSKPE